MSRALAQRALQRRAETSNGGADDNSQLGKIIGKSPAMLEVYKTVARVAPTKSTALILGESGTGKELIAQAIHQHSPRANRAFVAVDCGALTETILESELFGHVRGAFTGALADKKGVFEEAQGGTCFLDEIGGISAKHAGASPARPPRARDPTRRRQETGSRSTFASLPPRTTTWVKQ